MSDDRDQGMSDDTRRDLAELMAAMKVMRGSESSGGKSQSKYDAGLSKLPGKGEWIASAPQVAMACFTIMIVTFVVVFGVLAITGTPTDPFFRLINLFVNTLGAIGALVTLGFAMLHSRNLTEQRKLAILNQQETHSANVNSEKAATAVNGALEARIARVVGATVRPIVEDAVRRAVTGASVPPDGQDGAPTREINP